MAEMASHHHLIEAMELSLCELDIAGAREVLLAGDVSEQALLEPESLRRLLAGARLVSANCRARALLGLGSATLPTGLAALWPFAHAATFARALLADGAGLPSFRAETRLRRVGGGEIPVIFTSWREPGDEAERLRVGLVDITPQVRAEAALDRLHGEMAHAGRISILGELTASVAHEVRQPLAGITTFAEAAQRWLARPQPDLEQVQTCLANIVIGSRQANEVVARLRAMATGKTQSRAPCDLNRLIEETMQFLRHEMSSRQITARLDLEAELPPVAIDRVQVQQVVVNLALNAAQAMADAQCWSRVLCVRTRLKGDAIWIEVEDSGPGIAPADRERLFDGFFTTKSNGLGLGLRICRSIVENHGGTFELRSKASAGSVFAFSLPLAPAAA
jgi:signal transduction histidine kinase